MCRIQGLDKSGVPIGTIQDFGQAALPFGFVACDGSVVSQTGQYAALFAKIGTTYNTGGEGVGNFRLPGLPGKVRAMPGNYTDPVSGPVTRTPGQSVGAEAHVLTTPQTPAHKHISGWGATNSPAPRYGFASGLPIARLDHFNTVDTDGGAYTSDTGGGQAHNNMQPTLVVGNVGIAYI